MPPPATFSTNNSHFAPAALTSRPPHPILDFPPRSPLMETSRQLDLLAHTGVLLLENGAAIYRVEETLHSLGKAFGIRVGVYAAATGLIISSEGGADHVTRVRSIERHGVDMNLLAE